MTIKNLIGYQLVSINSEEIVVRKDDKEYTLHIIDDYGDCCGFNDITTELLISKTELQNNPIITNVELEQDCGDDEETAKQAKEHSNVNVLALPAAYVSTSKAIQIMRVWVASEFLGGRYSERLQMIADVEKENMK